jgi:hypothetical protein
MDTSDYSDTSDSETDDYIPSIREDEDLFAIDKTATKQLNYGNTYVPLWHEPEGFREVYQNW